MFLERDVYKCAYFWILQTFSFILLKLHQFIVSLVTAMPTAGNVLQL